jgi:hypothetical protein
VRSPMPAGKVPDSHVWPMLSCSKFCMLPSQPGSDPVSQLDAGRKGEEGRQTARAGRQAGGLSYIVLPSQPGSDPVSQLDAGRNARMHQARAGRLRHRVVVRVLVYPCYCLQHAAVGVGGLQHSRT